jgi:hypothetical protein
MDAIKTKPTKATANKLAVVQSTLEEAAMHLGTNSEFPDLEKAIDAAINQAASDAVALDDYLESFI